MRPRGKGTTRSLVPTSNSNTTSYVYDSANQLVRENNQSEGYTHVWTYDKAGNILSRTKYAYTTGVLGSALETVNYTYSDSQWGDLLTGYGDRTITSDAIGNTLSDGKRTYTWEHGRQLATLTQDGVTWTNTYNADGLRTKRTDGTNTYEYVYTGGLLQHMAYNDTPVWFTYAPDGTPISMTTGGATYFYITNLQGDVVALLNTDGEPVVYYAYDAWGNILSTTGSLATTIGVLNPLRYRGYVYDVETGLYYLQSRYYDPEIGRFINADAFTSTGQGFIGNNMFAYCGNNPVGYEDSTGNICRPSTAYTNDSARLYEKDVITGLRDVTDEVTAALTEASRQAKQYRMITSLLLGDGPVSIAVIYYKFYSQVNHDAPWDIKRANRWSDTIGTKYPGFGVYVTFNGIAMTPEQLGNFTYGYLGYAYDIPLSHLIAGSYYASDFPTYGDAFRNEIMDWFYIGVGYDFAYRKER